MANGTIGVSQIDILTTSGTGTLSIVPPATNTNRTLTLPDNTGTMVSTGSSAVVSQAMVATGVAGTGPAFSAYPNATQSIANNTATKLQYNTEEFDTANCYDNSTNYRFTPNVAGYYQINVGIQLGANTSAINLYINKNGSTVKASGTSAATNSLSLATVSATTYLNGSTDYIEAYTFQTSGGSISTTANSQWLFFQAFLARAA